LDFSVDII